MSGRRGTDRNRRRVLRHATLALSVAVVLPATSGAVVDPGAWQGPVQVARESSAQFSSVGAALGNDGRGLVVWATRRPAFEINAADVAADGTVGRPVVLSAPGDHAAAPLVGMASNGEAIIAWRTGRGARGVSACVRPAPGEPCVVQRLSPPARRSILHALTVGPDGAAIVVWLQQTRGTWRVAISQRTPGQAFGPARLIGPHGAGSAQVALGPLGAAVAFSRVIGRRRSEIRLASWLRGESPSVTHRVSPSTHLAVNPRLAIDGHDSAVVAWERLYRGGRFGIAHARFRDCSRGGCAEAIGGRHVENFDPVRRLGPPLVARGQASTYSLVAAASVDRLVLGWVHSPASDRAETEVRLAQWRAGSLTAPVVVSDPGYSGFDPQIAAAGGRTVVLYREYGRPGVRDGLVVARSADGDAVTFGPLAGLSNPTLIQQSFSRPRLALNASGAALAVFTNYGFDGSGAGEVALARLPAGP